LETHITKLLRSEAVESNFLMRKAVLLYNPLAGNRLERRRKEITAACTVLQDAGIEANAEPTQGAEESAGQAARAIQQGCDTVFACGGDGTVHDILQGMVGTNASLGLLPLGTGNVIAHDLALPLSPIAAARVALTAQGKRIAVGRIEYTDLAGNPKARFFLAVAGIGPDAHVFYKLSAAMKKRAGMFSYYARATQVWLTCRMDPFKVDFDDGVNRRQYVDASQVLAVRISNFGGVLRELAPGASLDRNDLRLVLFRTRSRIAYLRYILRGMVGANWGVPGIETAYSSIVECQPGQGSAEIFVEADGELLGKLPIKISVVPDAVTLLVPRTP
jgi:diacylglycerol kinase (ATP)